MAKKESVESRVRKRLRKTARKVAGQLAARNWKVSECAKVLESIIDSAGSDELKNTIKMDCDRWLSELHKLLTTSDPLESENCHEEQPAKKLKTGIVTEILPGNGVQQAGILSCASVDDCCKFLFGVNMDGLDSRISEMALMDGIAAAKKSLQTTVGASTILSSSTSLSLFTPVLRCLQAVAKCLPKDDESGGLAEFRSVFSRLKAILGAQIRMSVGSCTTQRNPFADANSASDGKLICEMLLLDLELLWADIISKSNSASNVAPITLVIKGKDQCNHNIQTLGGGHLLQISEFLLEDGLSFNFRQWGFKEDEAWIATFAGLWDLTRKPDQKDALYAHRIAMARKAKTTYSDVYSMLYSGSQIGFRETPLKEVSQIGAPPEFGAWINSASGRSDLMAAWSRGPQAVTKKLVKNLPLPSVMSISSAWIDKVGVADDSVEMAPEDQRLFFMDTEGSKVDWESTGVLPDSEEMESDIESLNLDELPGGQNLEGVGLEKEGGQLEASEAESASDLSEILSDDEDME